MTATATATTMTQTTTTTAKVVVGIDVGKVSLEASADGGGVQSFGNDDLGIGELVAWLATQVDAGGYDAGRRSGQNRQYEP